jgi:ribonuclease P protein component
MRLGQRYSSEHFMLHCAPRPAAPKLQTNRIGALLPKRWAKKAVRRNALRRQIYVLARQRLPLLAQAAGQPVDCVLRVRAAWSATVFISASSAAFKQSVEQELAALFTLAQGKMRPFAPSSSPKPSSAKPDNAVQA